MSPAALNIARSLVVTPARRVWRIALLAMFMLVSIGLVSAAAVTGWVLGAGAEAALFRHTFPRWCAGLLLILGVESRTEGWIPGAGGLVVANHVSWLDIPVLGRVLGGGFVAKSEVRSWPLMGWLAARAGTRFLERGRLSSHVRMTRALCDSLEAGERVILFPEGTTSDGHGVGAFKPALLRAASDARAAVLPVALIYDSRSLGHPGSPGPVPFLGEQSLFANLWALTGHRRTQVRIAVGPPRVYLDPRRGAAALQAEIQAALYSPDQGIARPPQPLDAAA